VAALALSLTGCTPPEPVEDPAVVWELDGTSPLESDPAIEFVRAADLAYRLAFNSLDFSRSDFLAAYPPSRANSLYHGFIAMYGNLQAEPRVYPGPAIWFPMSVETKEDHTIVVLLCDASDKWIIQGDTAPSYDLTRGFVLEYTLEAVDDHLLLIEETSSLTPCDATGAPVGRFDPVPVPPESISESDVVPPPSD
jgi:hypothetical protein